MRRNGERFGSALDHAWYGDGPGWNLRGNGGMLADARAVYDLFVAIETNPEVLTDAARAKWRPRGPDGRLMYASAGGNGIFNAVIARSVRPDGKGDMRTLTLVGMSNIAGQQIETQDTGALMRELLGFPQ